MREAVTCINSGSLVQPFWWLRLMYMSYIMRVGYCHVNIVLLYPVFPGEGGRLGHHGKIRVLHQRRCISSCSNGNIAVIHSSAIMAVDMHCKSSSQYNGYISAGYEQPCNLGEVGVGGTVLARPQYFKLNNQLQLHAHGLTGSNISYMTENQIAFLQFE